MAAYDSGNSASTNRTTRSAGSVSSVAAANTVYTVFPAGTIPNKARIKNPDTAIESLFVDDTGVDPNMTGTGTTVELLPGQTMNFGALTTDVRVTAATAGHAFHASKE
jgi:hypothetical protein